MKQNTPFLRDPNLKMMQCFTQIEVPSLSSLESNVFQWKASVFCLCPYSKGHLQFHCVQVRKRFGNLGWKIVLEWIVYKTTNQLDLSIFPRGLQLDIERYSPTAMHWHIHVFKRYNQNQLQTYWYTRNSRKLLQGAWILTTRSEIPTRVTV